MAGVGMMDELTLAGIGREGGHGPVRMRETDRQSTGFVDWYSICLLKKGKGWIDTLSFLLLLLLAGSTSPLGLFSCSWLYTTHTLSLSLLLFLAQSGLSLWLLLKHGFAHMGTL
jgi:hypothetical protein